MQCLLFQLHCCITIVHHRIQYTLNCVNYKSIYDQFRVFVIAENATLQRENKTDQLNNFYQEAKKKHEQTNDRGKTLA